MTFYEAVCEKLLLCFWFTLIAETVSEPERPVLNSNFPVYRNSSLSSIILAGLPLFRKPGKCPETAAHPLRCAWGCSYDFDCMDNLKCCPTPCGQNVCRVPILPIEQKCGCERIFNPRKSDFDCHAFDINPSMEISHDFLLLPFTTEAPTKSSSSSVSPSTSSTTTDSTSASSSVTTTLEPETEQNTTVAATSEALREDVDRLKERLDLLERLLYGKSDDQPAENEPVKKEKRELKVGANDENPILNLFPSTP